MSQKYNYTIVNLALSELNAKFHAIISHYLACGCDQGTAERYAIEKVQDDLARLTKYVGKAPHLDDNYSMTWGYKVCGMYESLDEMETVQNIVEAGF